MSPVPASRELCTELDQTRASVSARSLDTGQLRLAAVAFLVVACLFERVGRFLLCCGCLVVL